LQQCHLIYQVLFCSRTHSQLAQFVGQIQKSPYSDLRVVTLGSRQSLCVNDQVNTVMLTTHVFMLQLGSLAEINEKCLDLQENVRTS
jgi:chromosome transmission fidelity protein 1